MGLTFGQELLANLPSLAIGGGKREPLTEEH
jgi:hypothetical protein